MRSSFLAAAIVGVAYATADDVMSLDEKALDHAFATYTAKHGKMYSSLEEYEMRKSIFKEQDDMIRAHNNRGKSSFKLGHNHLSDLTKDERTGKLGLHNHEKLQEMANHVVAEARMLDDSNDTAHYMGLDPNTYAFNNAYFDYPNGYVKKYDSTTKATSMDWRSGGAVSDVVDQGGCNSSWAFMATEVVSSAYKIQKGTLYELSAQQLIDCARDYGADGCSGGYMFTGFEYYLDDNKPVTSTEYPYTGLVAASCAQSDHPGSDVELYEWRYVQPFDTAQLRTAILDNPVGVGINASCSIFQAYESGIFTGYWETEEIEDDKTITVVHFCPNLPSDLDHAAVLIGFGTDETEGDYFILKNTWGTTWGESGYMRIKAEAPNEYDPYGLTSVSGGTNGILTLAVTVSTGALSVAGFGLMALASLSF